MIIVRFPDETAKRKALEFLIGRFNGHTWATGEMAVPEEALGPMARAGISFTGDYSGGEPRMDANGREWARDLSMPQPSSRLNSRPFASIRG